MTASPLIIPVARFFDASGAPLSSGYVWTYQSGTSTPLPSYTSYTGLIANTNPVVLDSAGEANIWLDGNYRIAVYDQHGVLQSHYPEDGVFSVSTGNSAMYVTVSGTANNYVANPSPPLVAYDTETYLMNFGSVAVNTGPSVINVSNLGNRAIISQSGGALVGGELIGIRMLTDNGTAYVLINSPFPYIPQLNAYAVVCGGTTNGGQLQSIASLGTSGQFLKSNGSSTLPSMASIGSTPYTLIAGDTVGGGLPVSISSGTAGQLLVSNGSSAYPTWATGAGAAAYLSFNGTTNAIISSFGRTFSIARPSTGHWTITFSAAASNTGYLVWATSADSGGDSAAQISLDSAIPQTTTKVSIVFGGVSFHNVTPINLLFFGM